MSKAFSLLEFIFASLILALIFSFILNLFNQSYKNQAFFSYMQKIYDDEAALLKNEPKLNNKIIKLDINLLGSLEFLQVKSQMGLYSLKILDQEYVKHFKDEKSF